MTKLSIDTWINIFRNIEDSDQEEKEEFGDWVEVIWLEGNGVDTFEEWVLAHGPECFEDGFKSEREAMDRLHEVEKLVFKQ